MRHTVGKKRQKTPLLIAGVCILIVLLVGGFFGYRYVQGKQQDQAMKETAQSFITALEKQDYDRLTSLLSPESLKQENTTAEEVAERYEAIYGGIGLANVETNDIEVSKSEDTKQYTVAFKASMSSALGELPDQSYTFDLKEEDDTRYVVWTPALIFPTMKTGDTVKMERTSGKRGTILDRNGELLAGEGDAYQAGLHPSALGENRTEALEEIAATFQITLEKLESLLSQSWVTDESFVPFALRDEGNTPQLPGVLYQKTVARLYPLKEAAAHVLGYTGEVTAEDIEKNPALQPGEQIGKTGLEAALNDRLQGTPGGAIAIVDKDGDTREVLKETEASDGETITLTLDRDLQENAYRDMDGETGAAVVIAPESGELLVLASAPSYDPVKMSRGISSAEYQAYAEDERSPFLARYTARYAPGSTFKVLTAAIGLDAGTLNPSEALHIEGLKWTKDGSWGSDAITRVSQSVTEVDLQKALIYSDNIYFAQQALKMGGDTFKKGLDAFPFGKDTTLPIGMKPAQYANEGTFNSEKQVADTAYGQGDILMSPIHQAWFYTAIANQGTMKELQLIQDDSDSTESQPLSPESAATVKEMLKPVVTDPNGTARQLADLNLPIGAKTGTAEVNAADGKEKDTNGFMLVLDEAQNSFVLVSMLEDRSGGDTVRTFKPFVRTLFQALSK